MCECICICKVQDRNYRVREMCLPQSCTDPYCHNQNINVLLFLHLRQHTIIRSLIDQKL